MPRDRNPRELRIARHSRLRKRVVGTTGRPRLCVFRSLKHISVQVIDDPHDHTITAASSLEPPIKEHTESNKLGKAKAVGTLIAQRAREKGVTQVIFDRGGYKYHGRVKALAEAAREEGLSF